QKKVITEIYRDLANGRIINWLIQNADSINDYGISNNLGWLLESENSHIVNNDTIKLLNLLSQLSEDELIQKTKQTVEAEVAQKSAEAEVKVSTTGYRKGDPQAHPDTAFIFTENAEAYAYSTGIKLQESFPNPNAPKINVSDVNGTNQAGIRTDSAGNISKNAFGVVVKKFQQDANGNFVAKEGQFQDTDADFKLFVSLNNDMFKRLEESGLKKIVFPSQMALGKAALPLRFADWLSKELNRRFGITSTIEKNTKAGYDGYGLSINQQSTQQTNTTQATSAEAVQKPAPNYVPKGLDLTNTPKANYVDKGALGDKLAASNPVDGIRIVKDVTVQDVLDYISSDKGVTSKQKKRVFESLAKIGITKDALTTLLNIDKNAPTWFLYYHELSHLQNKDNDTYWEAEDSGKALDQRNYESVNKLSLEARATIDAYNATIDKYNAGLAKVAIDSTKRLFSNIIEINPNGALNDRVGH
ncbi:MAG: hypothetical protein HUJ71_10785, partial [Pseudobutyrivibrio sp.]|nr:hypothetical protein [Pseudobutyrivibrio sp.]